MSKKNLLRFTAFCLLTVLILFSLSVLFRDRDCTLSPLYRQPKDAVSVIIVGGSHVNSGFIPAKLWEDYGIAAENVYSWNQPMWTSYFYIREALRTQSPSVVVLDVFGMTYGCSYIMPQGIDSDSYANAFTIRPGLPLYEMMLTSRFVSVETPDLPDYLNLVRYHYRWKELFSKDFFENSYDELAYLHGYGMNLTRAADLEQADYSGVARVDEPYRFSAMFFEKIVKLCERKGITLVLTCAPYIYNETEQAVFNWIDAYAKSGDIPFLNYNSADGERIGFSLSEDMADRGHVNYFGALKLTNDLGGRLAGLVPAFEPSEFVKTERDGDSLKFNRIEKANIEVFPIEGTDEYLETALSDESYEWIFAVSGSSELSSELQAQTASLLGIKKLPERFIAVRTAADKTRILADDGEFSVEFADGRSYLCEIGGGGAAVRAYGAQLVPSGEQGLVLYDSVLERSLEYVIFEGENAVHTELTKGFWSEAAS